MYKFAIPLQLAYRSWIWGNSLLLSIRINNFVLFWVILDIWSHSTYPTLEEVPHGIRELHSSYHVYFNPNLCISILWRRLLVSPTLEVASGNSWYFSGMGEQLYAVKRGPFSGAAHYHAFKCLLQFHQDNLFASTLDTDIQSAILHDLFPWRRSFSG